MDHLYLQSQQTAAGGAEHSLMLGVFHLCLVENVIDFHACVELVSVADDELLILDC